MSKENVTIIIAIMAMLLITAIAICVNAQNNDFERWTSIQVKESAIFGGQTKTLYDLTSPWQTTNTHARVLGTNKAATCVYPTPHNEGKACILKVEQISFTIMGIPVNAIAAGSIFLGEINEITSIHDANEPMKVLNMNYAYTNCPKVLSFDYETYIEQSTDISVANASKQVKHYKGHDGAEVIVLLQQRWEDANERVYAKRIATGGIRFYHSTNGWTTAHVALRYGDISTMPDYHDYEGLNAQGFMVKNKRGKMTVIEEIGYDAIAQPTHLIIMFSAGCQPAFAGHVGNWIKIDNVCLH